MAAPVGKAHVFSSIKRRVFIGQQEFGLGTLTAPVTSFKYNKFPLVLFLVNFFVTVPAGSSVHFSSSYTYNIIIIVITKPYSKRSFFGINFTNHTFRC
ncbi:ORF910 [White spot syndrome virus]|uniref:WSSV455 n=2 Tax=White spot syndrome virus TaxID=342409 RepID=Q8QTB5_WSSV|nr:WSSV455 [Shrimp white spot syndrome virus]AFX59773.1 wsv396 [White spot syndrome virus]ATU83677.1 ORF910 [White spot syndrome virus]AWQ60521.1 wsv396 [Shrimp white spot syndrome virus]AWQ60966.1 wsv396 [Shrimp white spot syndrome virus]